MELRCLIYFTVQFFYMLVSTSLQFLEAEDSMGRSQILIDGMSLISNDANGTFELGFFTPGNSKYRYLGIWYKNIPVQTVVWVANRDTPITDRSGILTMNSTGNLVLSQNGTVVWSSSSQKKALNPVAQLLDNGNLVIREEQENDPGLYLWQSFDHPTDTLLAGMKFGWDLRIGLNTSIKSWKSSDDPSSGDFSWVLVPHSYFEFYMFKGTEIYYRSGPWNGVHLSGSPDLRVNPLFDYKFFFNYKDEAFYQFTLKDKSVLTRVVLNQTTYTRLRYVWVESDKAWKMYTSAPGDLCDNYALCGINGNCIVSESPVCQCLKGFSPKSPQEWNSMDWSKGCIRNTALNCSESVTDGFAKLNGIKLPDTSNTRVDQTQSMSLEECRVKCLSNCSCTAYSNTDIRGAGTGCALWFGDLVDMRQMPANEQDLYIRMPASVIEAENPKKKKLIVAVAAIIAAVLGILLLGCVIDRSKTYLKGYLKLCVDTIEIFHDCKDTAQLDEVQMEDVDLLLLDLSTVASATNNFSDDNKIGQGGFGHVYKGKLPDGQEIAVKRLSRSSGQGISEFVNEVKLIARLQHRNLVKLLACCVQGEEKMLIYEYMPNGSLDNFIFDKFKGKLLDWSTRFQIICAIARGLLYLHQDSRLRIIHRDLKASNVLLDSELNPKISDFGVAKAFGGDDQTHGNTKRVIGTQGYMAPEYASDGLFSVKSDVFSFGILLLEIISGKRNRGFYHPDNSQNLVCQTWRLWTERRPLELIDKSIEDSCPHSEVLRCIQIGLLCVQLHPEDRPTMSSVILMLGSETELSKPQQPGFLKKGSDEGHPNSSNGDFSSTNDVTLSIVQGR